MQVTITAQAYRTTLHTLTLSVLSLVKHFRPVLGGVRIAHETAFYIYAGTEREHDTFIAPRRVQIVVE
jgi:hypothetical protein